MARDVTRRKAGSSSDANQPWIALATRDIHERQRHAWNTHCVLRGIRVPLAQAQSARG